MECNKQKIEFLIRKCFNLRFCDRGWKIRKLVVSAEFETTTDIKSPSMTRDILSYMWNGYKETLLNVSIKGNVFITLESRINDFMSQSVENVNDHNDIHQYYTILLYHYHHLLCMTIVFYYHSITYIITLLVDWVDGIFHSNHNQL